MNRTMIRDLPDIDSISKHIQQPHIPPVESGMTQPPQVMQMQEPNDLNMDPQFIQPMPQYESHTDNLHSNLHCQDVYKHVKQCHVCQYYYNTNFLLYINIIGLLIIIFILLKLNK